MVPDHAKRGELKRTGYRGGVVWNITNVQIDENGIQFEFDGVYAKMKR